MHNRKCFKKNKWNFHSFFIIGTSEPNSWTSCPNNFHTHLSNQSIYPNWFTLTNQIWVNWPQRNPTSPVLGPRAPSVRNFKSCAYNSIQTYLWKEKICRKIKKNKRMCYSLVTRILSWSNLKLRDVIYYEEKLWIFWGSMMVEEGYYQTYRLCLVLGKC